MPPKAKGRKRNREADKPLSGLDVDALLHKGKRAKISPENAIPEFKQALSATEDIEAVSGVVKQMSTIIEDQIRHSLGDANYDRVIEEVGVMRDELVAYEEPKLYNDFARQLKDKILKEELGGDRRELWWLIRRSKLGLIDKSMSEQSDVSEEEAKEASFLLLDSLYTPANGHSSFHRSNKSIIIPVIANEVWMLIYSMNMGLVRKHAS